MKKDIFEEERKLYRIEIIQSHHKGTGRAIIMTKKNLGTKLKINEKTMMSDTHNGGNLRRK